MITIKLDYTLNDPKDRLALVEQILAETPDPPEAYLEILGNYLSLCMEKQERRNRKLLTNNRLATITKRETSFEKLAGQLENGEDGIYDLIANDKNIIFQPKMTISQQDIDEIPFLAQLRDSIERWEEKAKSAEGRDAFIIKRTLIEMRKDQYIIRNAFRRPIVFSTVTHTSGNFIELPSEEWISPETEGVRYSGISLLDPQVISTILQNYYSLKSHSYGKFQSDTWYLMVDFDLLFDRAMEPYPMYRSIVKYKEAFYSNEEIKALLEKEFGSTHTIEYISALWRNKIPKLIAQQAANDWLDWYYTEKEYGRWKKCNRCGQIKLAHPRFFSINKTAKDHFYSICKQCRNKKKE